MMKVAKTTLRSVLCAALFTLGTVSTLAWLIGFGSGLVALCAALLSPPSSSMRHSRSLELGPSASPLGASPSSACAS